MASGVGLRFTLDSNIIIYEIDGKLSEPLPTGAFFVSVVSKIELLSFPGNSPAQETQITALLATVDLVGVTQLVVDEAIRLRKLCCLRLPDAIIAATAIITGSELLTHDAGLLKVPGLNVSAPPLKP